MKRTLVQVALLVVAIVFAMGYFPATPVEAGITGQQLIINASSKNSQGWDLPGFTALTVSGNNQSNRPATWTWRSGQSYSVTTSNWWWRGTVTIQATYNNGSKKTCSTNVPTVQLTSNFWTVNCSSDVPNPPKPPSNARLGNVTSESMTFSWNDNSNSEQGFKIERRNGGGWSQIATVGANTTSYNSSGLNYHTQYCFRVRAYNTGGDSSYSNETCATTPYPPAGRDVDRSFFSDVLGQLGIPSSTFALDCYDAWKKSENTSAYWNPLATTQYEPGSWNMPGNSAGVKNYPNRATGVMGTKDTLKLSYYAAIRDMLSKKSFNATALRTALITWSGNGAYVTPLINTWQSLWNRK